MRGLVVYYNMNNYTSWGLTEQREYQNDLDYIYSHHTKDGYDNNLDEKVSKTTGVYGELTEHAVEHIMHELRDEFQNNRGVFYDLGSGTGKVVAHIALGSQLSKVCGIEFDTLRYDKSIKLINSIKFPRAIPNIIHGDFFKHNYSDASIIYFDNIMWYDYLLKDKKLVMKLFKTVNKGTIIVSKHEIPYINGRKTSIKLNTSYNWSGGCITYYENIS